MSAQERKEILSMYEGLRVTDVNDGMDAVGLQNIGCISRDIKPLWKDFDNFAHRFYGFALTARYIPTNQAIHATSLEDYLAQKKHWYKNIAPRTFSQFIQDGDVIVLDGATNSDVGFCGSENTFGWINQGARGVVTNGGARDTDEIIKARLPVYCAYTGRGIRPGRIEYDTHNVPVNIGGVLVRPGDIIVADGDGVVCVPIEKAVQVAKIAKEIQDGDKATRRKHYEKAGLELDFTVL